MNFNLREPNPGDKISANLIREIIRAIRSLTPISGHRMKTSTGPNGTVYDVKDEERNKSRKEPDKGRYAISSIEVDDQGQDSSTASITFANPYYRVGGKTYTGGTTIADVELPAIVALKVDITGSIPEAELTCYSSLSELQADEADEEYYIHPLYKFDENGSVECDFRIGPTSEMGEFKGVPT